MTDPSNTGAVVVASVSYRVVDRPVQVPASFTAVDGVDLCFLSYTTIDGVTNLAALVQPQTRQPGDTTLIMYVHGSGGNFYGPVAGREVMPLAQKGYAGLTISTRGHDQHINTDNFFDTRNDLAEEGSHVTEGDLLGHVVDPVVSVQNKQSISDPAQLQLSQAQLARMELAATACEDALRLAREDRNRRAIAWSLLSVALVRLTLRDHAGARSACLESVGVPDDTD